MKSPCNMLLSITIDLVLILWKYLGLTPSTLGWKNFTLLVLNSSIDCFFLFSEVLISSIESLGSIGPEFWRLFSFSDTNLLNFFKKKFQRMVEKIENTRVGCFLYSPFGMNCKNVLPTSFSLATTLCSSHMRRVS